MTQPIVQYCENCGKPLNTQARFCGRCGTPVHPVDQSQVTLQQNYSPPLPATPPSPPVRPIQKTPPPPPPVTAQPAAAPQTGEIVVTALPMGSQRSGFLGMKAEGYILVLTNLRILVAKQTSELMKENARLAKENAKESGKGLFGQWGAVIGSYGGQRYLQMHPQQILNETPGNYFILNQQVQSVRIKENHDPERGQSETKLTLKTPGGKFELNYNQANKRELKRALQQTLGNLVR